MAAGVTPESILEADAKHIFLLDHVERLTCGYRNWSDQNPKDLLITCRSPMVSGRQCELVMTVVKGGHLSRELVQAVWQIKHRIDQLFGLSGPTKR